MVKMLLLTSLIFINIGLAMPSRIVQPGDTLTQLAKGTGYTVDELAYYNRLSDPNQLRVGQDFFVPYSRQEFEADVGPMAWQPVSTTVTSPVVSQPVVQQPQAVPTSQAQIVQQFTIPWQNKTVGSPQSLPKASSIQVWTGDDAINRIRDKFLPAGEDLTEIQKAIVRREAYTEDFYQDKDSKGNPLPAVGVGQTGDFLYMSPIDALKIQENRVKSTVGEDTFDNLPLNKQEALLDAYYRGDIGYYESPYKWIGEYAQSVTATNPRVKKQKLQDAYEEVWNSNEYIERLGRIKANKAKPDDKGIMNRVQGWMQELFGSSQPPEEIQDKINAYAAAQ
jgi:hypothetical protein